MPNSSIGKQSLLIQLLPYQFCGLCDAERAELCAGILRVNACSYDRVIVVVWSAWDKDRMTRIMAGQPNVHFMLEHECVDEQVNTHRALGNEAAANILAGCKKRLSKIREWCETAPNRTSGSCNVTSMLSSYVQQATELLGAYLVACVPPNQDMLYSSSMTVVFERPPASEYGVRTLYRGSGGLRSDPALYCIEGRHSCAPAFFYKQLGWEIESEPNDRDDRERKARGSLALNNAVASWHDAYMADCTMRRTGEEYIFFDYYHTFYFDAVINDVPSKEFIDSLSAGIDSAVEEEDRIINLKAQRDAEYLKDKKALGDLKRTLIIAAYAHDKPPAEVMHIRNTLKSASKAVFEADEADGAPVRELDKAVRYVLLASDGYAEYRASGDTLSKYSLKEIQRVVEDAWGELPFRPMAYRKSNYEIFCEVSLTSDEVCIVSGHATDYSVPKMCEYIANAMNRGVIAKYTQQSNESGGDAKAKTINDLYDYCTQKAREVEDASNTLLPASSLVASASERPNKKERCVIS
jgi:hypothetical protein